MPLVLADEERTATIVVVGVGYVGRSLLDVLPDDKAFGLSRSVGGPQGRIRKLDLDDNYALRIEPPHDGTIIYTVPPASDHDGDRRLKTFLRLLTLAPRRFIYMSTTGVYGNRDGAVVDETTDVAPESKRAERRVLAERCLQKYCERKDVELIILRVPGIYGPGRLGVERIREGQPVLDEADANAGNRIHVDDLVSCCIAALAINVPAGIYNVGDGDERSSTWFTHEVAHQLGVPAPPTVSKTVAEQSFSTRRLSILRESRRIDLTRMHEVLNVVPKYDDAADGIAASLEEEQQTER